MTRIPRLAIYLMRALADQHHFDNVWEAMHWEWGSPGEKIIAARARGAFEHTKGHS